MWRVPQEMKRRMTDEIGGYCHPTFLAFLASIPTALIIGTFLGAKIAIIVFISFMLAWFAIDSQGRLR